MALSESYIERVCTEVLALENAYLTELSALLLSHLKQGIWDASDEVILLELKDELSTRVNTLQAKHEPVIEHKLTSEVIAALMGAALVDLSNLKKHYDEPIQPVETTKKRLKTTAEQLTTGLVTTLRRQNLAMAANVQKAWYEASTEAITGIQKGGLSYDEALSNAVRTLGESFTVRYSSGRTTSPDVALRSLMVTEMSQAGGRMSLEAMESYGHELAITSTHYGARPSHAMWQGKPFGIHGAAVVDGVKYPGMVELTDYGSVTGLKGINCRHMIEPYFPNITELPDREFKAEKAKWGKSSDEYYEATQRQRALERRVRATKTTVAQMEKVGLGLEDPAYVQKRLVLGRQQRELKAWVNANKLPRQPLREKAYGVAKQPRALYAKPNIQIGKSLGAAAFRDDVLLPDGTHTKITEGSKITSIVQIAGKGQKRKIDEIDGLLQKYGGERNEWQKMRGNGYVDDLNMSRPCELHWYQEKSVGRVKMKVKKFYY